MPLLTIVPPMPGTERRFMPFVEFVHTCGWETRTDGVWSLDAITVLCSKGEQMGSAF